MICTFIFPLGGTDYGVVGPMQLTLDENKHLEFPFDILDDQIHEFSEFFVVHLSSTDTDIVLNPQDTIVRIADDDGKHSTLM